MNVRDETPPKHLLPLSLHDELSRCWLHYMELGRLAGMITWCSASLKITLTDAWLVCSVTSSLWVLLPTSALYTNVSLYSRERSVCGETASYYLKAHRRLINSLHFTSSTLRRGKHDRISRSVLVWSIGDQLYSLHTTIDFHSEQLNRAGQLNNKIISIFV